MLPKEYKPKFVLWTSFLVQLPFQIFFSFWMGGFFGAVLKTWISQSSLRGLPYPQVAIGLAVFLLFPAVVLSVRRLNYRRTSYKLFPNRIVIEEGFFARHSKEINISAIREVSLRRGVFQRLVGLGSVYVATQATGQGPQWYSMAITGGSSTFASGAMLMDLPNSGDAYDALRALLDNAPGSNAILT